MPESKEWARNSELPASVISWIEEQGGGGWRVRQYRPLPGGISSAVYEMQLERNGKQASWVLRQFTDRNWLEEEPDLAVHESEALQAALGYGIASPKWIASDPDGSRCGMPSVLMTRLPGEVVLMPAALEAWLEGLAQTLAHLHREGAGKIEKFSWHYYSYMEPARFRIPDWTDRPEAWREIARIINRPEPDYTPRFIHRDYHPANVLWERGRVSGIVDWVNACLGPAGIDVGHCRVNLVQLHGLKAAGRFLEAYRSSMAGGEEFEYDPYWDMLTLASYASGELTVYRGWTDLGVTHLHEDLLAARLDEYAESLLRSPGRTT